MTPWEATAAAARVRSTEFADLLAGYGDRPIGASASPDVRVDHTYGNRVTIRVGAESLDLTWSAIASLLRKHLAPADLDRVLAAHAEWVRLHAVYCAQLHHEPGADVADIRAEIDRTKPAYDAAYAARSVLAATLRTAVATAAALAPLDLDEMGTPSLLGDIGSTTTGGTA